MLEYFCEGNGPESTSTNDDDLNNIQDIEQQPDYLEETSSSELDSSFTSIEEDLYILSSREGSVGMPETHIIDDSVPDFLVGKKLQQKLI